MLGIVVATLLSADFEFCDTECFERAHPVAARIGIAHAFGGLNLTYAVRLVQLDGKQGVTTERLQFSWAVPISEVLEVDAGVSIVTTGRFEVVPGARYSLLKIGKSLVIAISAAAGLSWRAGAFQLRAMPSVELHLGPIALQLILDVDGSARSPASLWCGLALGF